MNQDIIGAAAGKVWKLLGAKDKVALGTLPKLVEEDGAVANLALGWLARENKVRFEKEGKSVFVRLTPDEVAAFKRLNGHGAK